MAVLVQTPEHLKNDDHQRRNGRRERCMYAQDARRMNRNHPLYFLSLIPPAFTFPSFSFALSLAVWSLNSSPSRLLSL